MREVYRANRDDHDVAGTLRRGNHEPHARQLWDINTGKPANGADTPEAIAVLERAMAQPARTCSIRGSLSHMYIHLMEMSSTPHKALRAADALRGQPRSQRQRHLLHMPTTSMCSSASIRMLSTATAGHRGRPQIPRTRRCEQFASLTAATIITSSFMARCCGFNRPSKQPTKRSNPAGGSRCASIFLMADWLAALGGPMKPRMLIRYGRGRHHRHASPCGPRACSASWLRRSIMQRPLLTRRVAMWQRPRMRHGTSIKAFAKVPPSRYVFNRPLDICDGGRDDAR